MNGRPTRTRYTSDYTGLVIPVCGEYGIKTTTPTPWKPKSSKVSSLHNEIVAFVRYIWPTKVESEARNAVLEQLRKTLGDKYTLTAVGSSISQLCNPISDLDVVCKRKLRYFHGGSVPISTGDLLELESKIKLSGFSESTNTVLLASVPIAKVIHKGTSLEVDISGDDGKGIRATRVAQVAVARLNFAFDGQPVLKIMLLVLKQFLSMRKLAETYTGGLSSYTLLWILVAWFDIEYPKLQRTKASSTRTEDLADRLVKMNITHNTPEASKHLFLDLGIMLIDFFDFYGRRLDCQRTVIMMAPKSELVLKSSYTWRLALGYSYDTQCWRRCMV